MTQLEFKSYCRNCGTPTHPAVDCCMGTTYLVVVPPAQSEQARESRANFKLASRILGRKAALIALSRMARKGLYFAGQYGPDYYEDWKQSSLSVLGQKAKTWAACPRKYKAHQRALHALRACLNSPEDWTVRETVN
jgi:hypothetical protein